MSPYALPQGIPYYSCCGRLLGDAKTRGIYDGVLPYGYKVVVIKLKRSGLQWKKEFYSKIGREAKLNHPNLVALKRMLLNHPNGLLDWWLHHVPRGGRSLDWDMRMKVTTTLSSRNCITFRILKVYQPAMGEIIDTKPIESVKAAVSLFGEKYYQKRNKSPSKDDFEDEEEFDKLLKHLANIKVQLESKDSSHKQTLLQLENNQRTVEELSGLLKSSEIEKEIYLNECKEATVRVNELEATVKDMAYQLAESVNLREQISKILSELRATEEQVLRLETEIAAEKYAKLKSMQQIEVVETALSMEKAKTEEFSRQVVELNTTLMDLKMAAAEAEKEKDSLISAKETELKLAEAAAIETQEKIQSFTKRLEMMRSLENQILDKSMYIELLQNELQETKELHSSSEKVVFDAIREINQLKADLELKEGKNKDQADYIELLETELQELKQEFSTKNEEMNLLVRNVDEMKEELEKTKSEVTETRKEVTEAEGEIALLKSELHQSKSRIAAAEEKAKSKVTALYAALEQLESEAEETKKENEELKVARKVTEESENYFTPYIHHEDNNQSRREKHDENQKNDGAEEVRIPKEVYNSLIKMAKQAEELKLGQPEFRTNGTENPKKELEIATSKVSEFRTRAEQAISRAEIAEKGKAELEEKLKKWEEKRAKKRAALAVLEDEATSKAIVAYRYDDSIQKLTQPLGKILNMQF